MFISCNLQDTSSLKGGPLESCPVDPFLSWESSLSILGCRQPAAWLLTAPKGQVLGAWGVGRKPSGRVTEANGEGMPTVSWGKQTACSGLKEWNRG